jgi:transcriptional regulator with XRE-family HTH domain
MTDRDYGLFAAQVRAARGLLNWSQADLAEAADVHRVTVMDIESGKREPHDPTLTALVSAITDAGIAFTEKGVEFRKWPLKNCAPNIGSRRSKARVRGR